MSVPDRTPLPLMIRLFGPFEVLLNGDPLPRLRSRRGYWLLALLTLRHGREIDRAWLAGTLWPDSPEAQAFASLRKSLNDLRQALGREGRRIGAPAPQALSLDLSGAHADVVDFDQAIARGDESSLERAVALYRGPLLEGCAEEWAFQERQAREHAYLQALERLAGRATARGDPEAALRHLRLAVAVDPLHESLRRVLMQALAASGNYAAALLTYRELRLLLHRELNAEPDPETQALFQQIRTEARRKAALGSSRLALGEGGGLSPGERVAAIPAKSQGRRAKSQSETTTLTFLFTFIEGDTSLWRQHPVAMGSALGRFEALLTASVERRGGAVIHRHGERDLCFAVFSRGTDAVAAAVALQRALLAEPWPGDSGLPVGVVLHTGEAELQSGDDDSPAIRHCARLGAIGHGGQTLLSQTTSDLVRDDLPEGVSLWDLGLFRLEPSEPPEHVFQLLHPELPAVFPPLRLPEAFAHNLPIQWTSFIGREWEMAEVQRLLSTAHLLTLTGAGGCGKTRLALQVAASAVEAYPGGVWLVELAAVADPALVPQVVAAVVGVQEQPGRPLLSTLVEYLRGKRLLMVLDNCEHWAAACAQLAEALLRGCPHVRLLATSREALGITGELTYYVPSLSLPDLRRLPAGEADQVRVVTQYESVRLFLERAVLRQPHFTVRPENARAVAEVCCRLDGIPLAIELAASMVKLLSVEQIAARLDDRFQLLTRGSRTALPRQQTLRASMDWSYDLLSKGEQVLLRRLSVFPAGWTLEAAEAICSDSVGSRQDAVGSESASASPLPTPCYLLPTEAVLDLLSRLVDKSLVQVDERGSVGYRLLETVRQYSGDRLRESGEADKVRGRHHDWFLQLAEQAKPALVGAAQGEWLERLEAEHDNLRAALSGSVEAGELEASLRLGAALWRFWYIRGHLGEGRQRLGQVLALAEGAPPLSAGDPTEQTQRGGQPALRARVLSGAGVLASAQGDHAAARALHEESLAIRRALGGQREIAGSLFNLGTTVHSQGDYTRARALYEESLAIHRALDDQPGIAASLNSIGNLFRHEGDNTTARTLYEESLRIYRALDDKTGVAVVLNNLGNAAENQGNYETARALYEEGLAIQRELGNQWAIGKLLYNLGNVARAQGDYPAARALLEESLAIDRELGHQRCIAASLHSLGRLAHEQGDHGSAVPLYRESLEMRRALGDQPGIAECLEGLAELAGAFGRPARAARLWGAAELLRQAIRRPLPPSERPAYERHVADACAALGESGFAAAWAEGQAMSPDQAIAYALEECEISSREAE